MEQQNLNPSDNTDNKNLDLNFLDELDENVVIDKSQYKLKNKLDRVYKLPLDVREKIGRAN